MTNKTDRKYIEVGFTLDSELATIACGRYRQDENRDDDCWPFAIEQGIVVSMGLVGDTLASVVEPAIAFAKATVKKYADLTELGDPWKVTLLDMDHTADNLMLSDGIDPDKVEAVQ